MSDNDDDDDVCIALDPGETTEKKTYITSVSTFLSSSTKKQCHTKL